MKEPTAAVNFFIIGKVGQLAFRRMHFVPRAGDTVVFDEKRYTVESVEWCLYEGATESGVRVNVELRRATPTHQGAESPEDK